MSYKYEDSSVIEAVFNSITSCPLASVRAFNKNDLRKIKAKCMEVNVKFVELHFKKCSMAIIKDMFNIIEGYENIKEISFWDCDLGDDLSFLEKVIKETNVEKVDTAMTNLSYKDHLHLQKLIRDRDHIETKMPVKSAAKTENLTLSS